MVFRKVTLITCCEYNHKKRYVVKLNLEERDQLDGITTGDTRSRYDAMRWSNVWPIGRTGLGLASDAKW